MNTDCLKNKGNCPRVVLAGASSGVGKTTLACGIMRVLAGRGFSVQPFKTGPDYIDPSYHRLASGLDSRNLDTWMLSKGAVLELFERQAKKSDISIIEGVMGLYDGYLQKEEGSSAHLAKILNSPVILILNARSLSTSAAAIALGYKEFDKKVDLRGIILNNIGSPSHYQSIKYAIERKTKLPVLGFLPKDSGLALPERHLGLVPAQEKIPLEAFMKTAAELVEKNIDINAIIKISQGAGPLPVFKQRIFKSGPKFPRACIALAKDQAFNFYYQDNLEILKYYGVDIIEFSPLKDKYIPEGASGLYVGGGFPELFASQLSRNIGLKKEIFKRAKEGMPIYAECGGLMYLMRNIVDFKNRSYPMVGVFNSSARMNNRLSMLGYVNVEAVKNNILSGPKDKIRAHAFHWSYIQGVPKKASFAYILKKEGKAPAKDGFIRWNTLASYAHLHFASNLKFVNNFIRNCKIYADETFMSVNRHQ